MKDKKIVIGLIVLVIIILIIIVLVSGVKFESKGSDNYLVIDNYLILQKNGNKYKQIEEFNKNVLDQKYTIYGDTTISNLKMQYDETNLYFFDDNYKQQIVENYRGASSFDVKFADYETERVVEDERVEKALALINVYDTTNYFTVKYIFDFDNDGLSEVLYLTSNYVFDDVDYDINSILYTADNDIIISHPNNILAIEDIVDLDNDGKYELIISKGYLNLPQLDSCYQVYKFNDDWEMIHDCQ